MRISDWSSDVCSSDLTFRYCKRAGWAECEQGGNGGSVAGEYLPPWPATLCLSPTENARGITPDERRYAGPDRTALPHAGSEPPGRARAVDGQDRKSTRLNSSH